MIHQLSIPVTCLGQSGFRFAFRDTVVYVDPYLSNRVAELEGAADIGAGTLIPMHWDMFAPNSVYPEEIMLLYDLARPPFKMVLRPDCV